MSPTALINDKGVQVDEPLGNDGEGSVISGDYNEYDCDFIASSNASDAFKEPENAISGDLTGSATARAHLEKFVKFIEKYIAPQWHRAAGTSKRKFRFTDLFAVFQPGELLHFGNSSDSAQGSDNVHGSSQKTYQTAWRLYSLCLDAVNDERLDDTDKVSGRSLHVHAYYWDYDGKSYVPVRETFFIKDYEGERDITTLEVFPLRFLKDAENVKQALRKQGSRFREVVSKKHLSYDGWTLANGPTITPSPLPVEHIEGDVIIDFVEGYKSDRLSGFGPYSWAQGFDDGDDNDLLYGDDEIPIMHWRSSGKQSRLEMFADIREKIQRGEAFFDRLKKEEIDRKESLQTWSEKKDVKELDDDDLMLLPRRVVAYAFRERSLNQDVIRGKGSGLVILLHGVPGVGKTATAEAVAQANKKPLFVITCGDLGFTPRDVEDSLKDIFRLAHLWDCILLLDEADVFLSRRELGDLKRNALVSVFLRVLEYYSGILFLTTNRVGTLDEAFKSRIHVSLYYPRLDLRQTLDIFEVNIELLEKIIKEKQKLNSELEHNSPKPRPLFIDRQSILGWAERHFYKNEATPELRWNGRQIRNAFQIAYSLAEFDIHNPDLGEDDEIDEGVAPSPRKDGGRLDFRQFDMVAQTIESFEDYLTSATSGTDADRARVGQIRDDNYDPRQTPQRTAWTPPSYNRQPPQRQQRQPPVRRPGPNGTAAGPRPLYQDGQASPVRRPEQQPQRRQQPQPQQQRLLGVPAGQQPQPRQPATAGTPPPRGGRAAPPSPQYSYGPQPRSTNPNRPPLMKHKDSGYSSWSAATPRTMDPAGSHEQARGRGLGAAMEEREGEGEEGADYADPGNYDGYDEGTGVAGEEYEQEYGEHEQGYYDDTGRYHAWEEEGVEARY
ncbi:hypothetical protein VTH06DRAFT_8250 [Thermothelomyces fergusii]